MVTESQMDGYLGATKGTNATAELSAIAYACLYILQSDIFHVVIYYDAKYAANMASAQWSPDTDVGFVDKVAEIVALAEVKARIELVHVYSHVGDPWNEMADAGADVYSLGRLTSKFRLPSVLQAADY